MEGYLINFVFFRKFSYVRLFQIKRAKSFRLYNKNSYFETQNSVVLEYNMFFKKLLFF